MADETAEERRRRILAKMAGLHPGDNDGDAAPPDGDDQGGNGHAAEDEEEAEGTTEQPEELLPQPAAAEVEGVEAAPEPVVTSKPAADPLASADDYLQRFKDESLREEEEEVAAEGEAAKERSPFGPLSERLREMRSLVHRAAGLAELHGDDGPPSAKKKATARDDDGDGGDADEPLGPLPALPAFKSAAGAGGASQRAYVCLDDGALVEAHELLEGPRRGAAYLPLPEAEAQCR
jgi:hypothetical protein